MTRKVWALALLFFMPFAGMRVVCVDDPAVPPAAGPAAAAQNAEADCESLCPWHPGDSDAPAGSSEDADCAMTADGASFVVMATATTTPVQAGLHIDMTVSETSFETAPVYIEPGLSTLSPPPKA